GPAGAAPQVRTNQRHKERGEKKRHHWNDRLSKRACLFPFNRQKLLEVVLDASIRPRASLISFDSGIHGWSISAFGSISISLRVIRSAALWIDQYISGTRNEDERLGSLGLAAVQIRVLQPRQPLVCGLDLLY